MELCDVEDGDAPTSRTAMRRRRGFGAFRHCGSAEAVGGSVQARGQREPAIELEANFLAGGLEVPVRAGQVPDGPWKVRLGNFTIHPRVGAQAAVQAYKDLAKGCWRLVMEQRVLECQITNQSYIQCCWLYRLYRSCW